MKKVSRFRVLQLKAGLLKDFSEAPFPGVLGEAAKMRRASDGQAGFRTPAMIGVNFDQLFHAAVAKDFLPQLIMLRKFPVERSEVARAGPRAFKVARLDSGERERRCGKTDAEIDPAVPEDRVGVFDPLAIGPADAEQLNIQSGALELVDDLDPLETFRAEKT